MNIIQENNGEDNYKKNWPSVSLVVFNGLRYHSVMRKVIAGLYPLYRDNWFWLEKGASLVYINPLILSIYHNITEGDKKLPQEMVVYLFRRWDGAIKVGVTGNLAERKKRVEKASGLKLSVVFSSDVMPRSSCYKIEAVFKQTHTRKREDGEWFLLSPGDAISSLDEIIWSINYQQGDLFGLLGA